jgi:hypothetical protein
MPCYVCTPIAVTRETRKVHRANEGENLGSRQSINLVEKIPRVLYNPKLKKKKHLYKRLTLVHSLHSHCTSVTHLLMSSSVLRPTECDVRCTLKEEPGIANSVMVSLLL